MASQTTAKTPSRETPGAGTFRLVVVFSPGQRHTGASVALGADPVEIGRLGEGAPAVALDDLEVSRPHAVIEPEGAGFRVRDLGSSNGTFVGGLRVESRSLADGDVLRVGGHVLLFQFVAFADAQGALGPRRPRSSLVGASFALERVKSAIAALATLPSPVIVVGESGSGKELVAQEIHRQSGRKQPLVSVNCAALPESLAESELYGHARGSFTGATEASRGLFGEADGGTLFLDEIMELSPALQAKLLRALATGEVRGVGETKARHVDVRVVAASNTDVEAAVERGTFRGDLHARLMGCRIEVPPLRARRDDILPLAEHFMATRDGPLPFTPDAAEALLVYAWPFNVRELQQVVRALPQRVWDDGALDLAHLPERLQQPVIARAASGGAPAEVPLALRIPRDAVPNAAELAEVIRHFGGSFARAAEYFGRDRKQIYRWLERLGVDPASFREQG